MNIDLLIVIAYSYLFGSIPFGLIFTKLFLKKDLRNIGSGNIGATNVLRTGNKLLATITLFFDVLKAYSTIYITFNHFSEYIFLSGLVCFLGHIFPIWLNFKGGKGIATYIGIIFSYSFELAIVFCVTWLMILLLFRYSSLSSIISTFMVFLFSLFSLSTSMSVFLFIIFIIVIFTHKENIYRLKNQTEDKVKF